MILKSDMKLTKRKIFSIYFLLVILSITIAQGTQGALRKNYNMALVVYNRSSGKVSNNNPELSAKRVPPCSTFKIYNTLIGLDLALLKEPDDPWYKWDGVHRGIAGWNKDLTLREAFRVSAVPAFQELARQIGAERMKKYIDEIGYGNRDISSGIDVFWLPREGKSSIIISADEQVALLNKLLDRKLPFSEKNISVLRSIMQVVKTKKGVLYGKTGSGTNAEGRGTLGWFVGFLESGGDTYVFACSITGGENPSGKVAREIVEGTFKAQGLL